MRNVSDKTCRENQNAFFILNKFFSENCTVYEVTWKNLVDPDRPHMAIRHMSFECWLFKTADTT